MQSTGVLNTKFGESKICAYVRERAAACTNVKSEDGDTGTAGPTYSATAQAALRAE